MASADRHRRSRNGRRPPSRVELGGTGPRRAGPEPVDLHVCGACGSRLVQPVEWAPVDLHRWRVALRCPDCGRTRGGVFTQEDLDRYDAILDRGAAELLAELASLEQANMRAEVERISDGINRGLIRPEDF